MDQLITVYFKNGAMLYRYWIRMHFEKLYEIELHIGAGPLQGI